MIIAAIEAGHVGLSIAITLSQRNEEARIHLVINLKEFLGSESLMNTKEKVCLSLLNLKKVWIKYKK